MGLEVLDYIKRGTRYGCVNIFVRWWSGQAGVVVGFLMCGVVRGIGDCQERVEVRMACLL